VLDGLILSGGGDIDPAHYGQPRHPTNYLIDSERDAFELMMARLAVTHDLPVLGICRGAQVLTVAHGGNMVADIGEMVGSMVDHGKAPNGGPLEFAQHPVNVAPDSLLAHIVGAAEMMVPSMHHQAAQVIPPGWRVTARAADGVVEAVEYAAHPWLLAVQWHPEAACEIPAHRNLFTALVAAAAQRRSAGAAQV
jgi:putative glutamine amidotransferase